VMGCRCLCYRRMEAAVERYCWEAAEAVERCCWKAAEAISCCCCRRCCCWKEVAVRRVVAGEGTGHLMTAEVMGWMAAEVMGFCHR
jgi:hypothetical protein